MSGTAKSEGGARRMSGLYALPGHLSDIYGTHPGGYGEAPGRSKVDEGRMMRRFRATLICREEEGGWTVCSSLFKDIFSCGSEKNICLAIDCFLTLELA